MRKLYLNNDRSVYEHIKKAGVIVTQSYLRLEQSIQGTQTSTKFGVLVNEGTPSVTEVRLGITDNFVVTNVGMFLMKAGAAVAATNLEKAQSTLRTWPNPLIFTGAAEAINLMGVYNGRYNIKINSTTYVENMDMYRYYNAPQSQKGVGPAVIIQEDQVDGRDTGYEKIIPTIKLGGAAKNDILVTYPTSMSMIGTLSENILVCILRGFLLQNDSKLNPIRNAAG